MPPVANDRTTFLPTAESTEKLEACFYYNAFMEAPPTDRRVVEAAVATLQERLADGDPADTTLQSYCDAVLSALRAAYRVTPTAFSKDTIETLRELSELLRQTDPDPDVGTSAAEPHEQHPPRPLVSCPDEGGIVAPTSRGTERGQEMSAMTADPKSTDAHEPHKRLSQKEFAKKMRHEAYLRAKEFRKTDSRQIAMKEKLKQQRRDAYQKVKKRGKVLKAERKKADEKAAAL